MEIIMNSSNSSLFDSREYRRSRNAYMLECAFEYFVAILASDAFLPYLLLSIGMPDSLTGITSSIISLSFLFQFFAVGIAQKVKNTKRFATLIHCFGQMFFMCVYLVPFLPFAEKYKHILVIACLLVAYFGNYLVTNIIFKWGNSFVEPHNRGTFGAVKEIISLLTGMVVSLGVGFAIDAFKASGNAKGAFIFAAIGIFVFVLCDFICLMLIKNEQRDESAPQEKIPLREVLSGTVGNKNFRSLIVLGILWNCAAYTSIGFLGSYRLEELSFSMGEIQIFIIVATVFRVLVSRPFGRYADLKSHAKSVELGLLVAAIGFAINIFTMPETRYLILVFTVLYYICAAGIGQPMINMTYNYVDAKYFVQACAIKNSIAGICGFLASLGAGKLLSVVQENGNMIFGMRIYGQQVLSAISLLFAVAALLYTHFVIGKQKIMIQ